MVLTDPVPKFLPQLTKLQVSVERIFAPLEMADSGFYVVIFE